MIAGKNCSNCDAYSALTSECRRESPRPFPVQAEDGRTAAIGIYPATSKDGWCAQWLQDVALVQ